MLQTRKFLIKSCRRYLVRSLSQMTLHNLKSRSLIQASGKDASDFLQGLITNDMNHLSSLGSMFTMFLNSNGRVLYDTIVYSTNHEDTYLIECDTEGTHILMKHLRMYRVRRKVDISNISDKYSIFALLDPNVNVITASAHSRVVDDNIVPCDKLKETMPNKNSPVEFNADLMIFKDPRISLLGSRIISRKDYDVISHLEEILGHKIVTDKERNYRKFRYMLGVGEGVVDLPPGNCFPLECNCDYLHGISFHKGCYIGQELTARTYHTGVVRKRLMPMHFSKIPKKLPDENKIIVNSLNLGKLRGIEENFGLGLLRIAKALELKELPIGDGLASVARPSWWPVEAPKERMGSQSG